MKRILLSLIALGWLSVSHAENEPVLVIQVPAMFYEHPTQLINPRFGYWHNRGKATEKVGLAAFQGQHYKTSRCQAEANGQALVVLVPNISYNPQMGIFHSEIIAKIYSTPSATGALEKPLVTVKGQGQSRGWLSYNAEAFIQKSYQQAVDQVIQQLQKDTTLQQALNQAPQQNYQALCDSIDTLAQSQLYS
jgi:hypothetical protein